MFYAQLQARLMVNMAGGVMENAGLCLDRFGMPHIPGSAVKGCARRMAIQSLLEKREGGANTEELSAFLADIANIFGWGELDWSDGKKDGRFKSDLAFAIGEKDWTIVCRTARQLLPNADHFAGSVSFLPAQPVDASGAALPMRPPAVGTLELDVLTCHHPDYYQGNRSVATDDEDPIPVVFPAVAAGHVFAFAILPLRNCTDARLTAARNWLSGGLAVFGLGAKTAAGYGWFDVGNDVQQAVLAAIQRATLKPSQALFDEFCSWNDKQIRKAGAEFAYVALLPKAGRASTLEYRFTLAKFILHQRTKLFVDERNHAGSDFAKGVKRLADEFQLPLP